MNRAGMMIVRNAPPGACVLQQGMRPPCLAPLVRNSSPAMSFEDVMPPNPHELDVIALLYASRVSFARSMSRAQA